MLLELFWKANQARPVPKKRCWHHQWIKGAHEALGRARSQTLSSERSLQSSRQGTEPGGITLYIIMAV